MERDLKITAYETSGRLEPKLLVKMPPQRAWIDELPDQFGYRCLPMVIAHQNGWAIMNPAPVTCVWNGGTRTEDLVVEVDAPVKLAMSHFGSGILTFNVPYLFRTPEGYNLWAKGPANCPKDGISALEGVIETDWNAAPFTMNWQMTRPNCKVTFMVGEPFCMIVPYPRHLVERFEAVIRPISADPENERAYKKWSSERSQFLHDLKEPGSEAAERKWQKEYFQGKGFEGTKFEQHQTHLDMADFQREE